MLVLYILFLATFVFIALLIGSDYYWGRFPLVIPIPLILLGLFTSAIQALIFATLAAYYIGEAVEEHH